MAQPKEKKHHKRRISLFKRRKKPEIRAFVREKKNKNARRFFVSALIIALGLLVLGMLLVGVKLILSETTFSLNGKVIYNPQISTLIPQEEILTALKKQPFTVDEINFSSQSSVVKFTANKTTKVYLSQEKDVDEQLKVLDAILRQLALDNKETILVDLRYNKPIVKFK